MGSVHHRGDVEAARRRVGGGAVWTGVRCGRDAERKGVPEGVYSGPCTCIRA